MACQLKYVTETVGKGKRAKKVTVAYIRKGVSKAQIKRMRGSKYGR